MRSRHRVRLAANLLNLSTPLGLLIALAGRCEIRGARDGLIICDGYRMPLPAAPAFTVGNVLLFRDARELDGRPELLAHEARHATQYAFCLGPVMLVLYLACAGVSLLLSGCHASYNPFERLAGLADGGYVKRPLRRRDLP
ncbi:hypothetical protein ACRYCC_14410 [Actinomadura scrupuli]|uniref:hypothetical protein n=1 Tax=Actinomadura scrupuli TaxID=559629 RepID=UPI003D9876C3